MEEMAASPEHSGHPVRWIAAAVAVVVALFFAVLATRQPAASRQASSPLLGKPAPDIRGQSVIDGRPVKLADSKGRFVLVNFVASWCVACAEEHSDLVSFTQRHRAAADADVLGVVFDDRDADVRRFFERRGGEWPVVSDPEGKVALDYGVRGPPESFLIDADGFVISKIIGRVTADGLDQLVRRAKAGARR
jgi:cytochrome c biogenesis protein CcmG/thiol:disulfide interchange protein DsbE